MNREELLRLDALIKDCATSYYEGHPTLSDEEFDALVQQAKKLSENFPELIPQLNVYKTGFGYIPNNRLVTLEPPMLSLQNAFTQTEVEKFFQKMVRHFFDRQKRVYDLNEILSEILIEPKYDGIAIELIYENGSLVRAATRGNGQIGENITENARTIWNIPKNIKAFSRMQIRGEVVITSDDFARYNSSREIQGLPKASNPRNLAAGSLRLKSSEQCAERPLSFYAYDYTNSTLERDSESLELLESLGFQTASIFNLHSIKDSRITEETPLDSVFTIMAQNLMEQIKETNTVPVLNDYIAIDGLVIKIDSKTLRTLIGETNSAPSWAVAYKLPSTEKVTELIDIEWSMGKTGILTPVAILIPVKINDVLVSRATMHNLSFVEETQPRPLSKVTIIRSGEVIPKIIAIKEPMYGEPFPIPERCPICEEYLQVVVNPDSGKKQLECPNNNCEGRLAGLILHMCSRDAFNILGVGEKIARTLALRVGCYKNIPRIFSMTSKDFTSCYIGHKIACNLEQEFANKKQVPFHRFLYSLGIPLLGKTAAKQFGTLSLDDFLNMRFKTTPALTTAIHEYLNTPGNFYSGNGKDFIQQMLLNGVKIVYPHLKTMPVVNQSPISGKTFAITGTLSNSRSTVTSLIESYGGQVVSLKKQVDYLIVGDKPSELKVIRAKKLGVSIISEQELHQLIGDLK